MATYTEIQSALKRVVRNVRAVYRKADTAGEKLERELDRLINRKRLIQPDDLSKAIAIYNEYDASVGRVAGAIAEAGKYLASPIVP